MIRKLSIVAFAVLAACGGSQSYTQKAQKSLSVTYETLQIAEKAAPLAQPVHWLTPPAAPTWLALAAGARATLNPDGRPVDNK